MNAASPEPPLLLLTGPAGSGKTTRALERIRLAATTPGARGRGAARPGEALLILPTYSQALHFQRLALSRWNARAVLDDPFATFTSAGERFLDGFRVRALPAPEERDRLMDEAARRAAVSAFESVRRRPGFRARLLRLVKEVKQSGLPAAEAAERLAAAAPRLADDARERLLGFLAVFGHYEALLDEAGLEDHEDTLRRLLEALRGTAVLERAPRVLVVDGFDDFTPVEQGILDALAASAAARGGEVVVTLPWDERRPALFAGSAPARRHLLARGYREEALAAFPRADAPALRRVASLLFGSADEPRETMELVVAGDPEDEAEAVARRARREMADGRLPRGWRDLGVIVRRLDDAGPRLAAAFERLGVPHRLVGAGRPLAAEGIVRALRGPLLLLARHDADDEPVDAPALLVWLRWRAFAARDDEAVASVDALEMGWRRRGFPATAQGWRTAVAAAGLDVDALDGHERTLAGARDSAGIHAALEVAVLDLAPLPPPGGLDADGRPIDAAADAHRTHAAAARDRVVALVRGLARASARTGLGEGEDARSAILALIDAVEHTRLALPDRRLDAVNILDAEEARFWEMPVVFVAGLAEGQFPLHPSEDVVLRDDERESLRETDDGLALPLARERETRERRLFYGVLTRARQRLVLFRPGSSADGDARSASLFLRDLARVVTLEEGVPRPAGRPAPQIDECFTPGDLALFAAARARDPRASDDERELARALLARGDETLERRAARWRRAEADAFAEAPLDRFRATVERVSATTLAAAVACRHRHFLGSVVGVPEDEVPPRGPAFGFRDEGTLLHEALRRALGDPEKPAEAIVAEVLAWTAKEGRRELAPLDDVERERLSRELRRVVTLFRSREASLASPLRPLAGGLEMAFGMDDGAEVRLGEGEGAFALHGRIDRVDARGRDAVVIDYKRSHTSVDAASKALDQGVDLQLPLYAAAVERLFDLEVAGFEWVAATRRVRRGRWRRDAEALFRGRREGRKPTALAPEAWRALRDGVLERASGAVAAIRSGDHALQREDAKRCGRCAWFAVCRTAFVRGRVPEAPEEGS